MRQRPSPTRWLLATALGCAFVGLVLTATAPDYDRPSPTRLANEKVPPAPRRRAAVGRAPRPSPDRGDEVRTGAPSRVVARGGARWFANPPRPPRADIVPDAAWFPAEAPRAAVAVGWGPPPVAVRRRQPDPSVTAVTAEPTTEPAPVGRKRSKRQALARIRRSAAKQRGDRPTAERPPEGSPTVPDTVPSPPPPGPPETDPGAANDVTVQTDDDLRLGTEEQIAIPVQREAPPEDGTVSLWVQPGWERGDEDDATFVQLGDQLRLAKNEDVLRLETAGTDDVADVGVPIADWSPGDWHQVTATWSEDGVSLYVDGELVGRRLGRGLMHLPAASELRVGSDGSAHARVARGLIGRVDLRHRSWGEDEVARAYRDAIGDRPDGAEEAGDRGAPDRGRSDGHTRDTTHGNADGSNQKPNPAARDVSHHRDRRG